MYDTRYLEPSQCGRPDLGVSVGKRTGYTPLITYLSLVVARCLMLFAALDEEIVLCKNRLKFLTEYLVRTGGSDSFTWDSHNLIAKYDTKTYGWIRREDGTTLDSFELGELRELRPKSGSINRDEINITFDRLMDTRFKVYLKNPR
jgi:hypothetical protein